MRKSILDSPLTTEEQDFARENYRLINHYMNAKKLPLDEWYDVVALGYLKAVRKYLTIPKLKEYSFSTIAYNTMWTAIGNELIKAKRRIKALSLDAVISDADNITYKDAITYENLRYVNYETGDETMKIRYNIELPERIKIDFNKSEERIAIEEFLQDDSKENMCFEYEDSKKAKSKASIISGHHRTKKEYKELYEFYRIKNCVYVKKTEKCKQILKSRSKTNEKKK